MRFLDTKAPFRTDTVLTIVYVVISFGLFLLLPKLTVSVKVVSVLAYVIGTGHSIYSIFYRALRNLYLFIVWLLIAAGHIWFCNHYQSDTDLIASKGFVAYPLNFTFVLLFTVQLIRFAFLKIFSCDFDAIFYHGETLFGNKTAGRIEYLGCAIYFIVTIIIWTQIKV